jgi:predicted DNA-binding transcriptional regulator AlpA
MEPLLSMEQAAQLLGLTGAQLYELTRNRSRARQAVPLPVIRIGKRKMFRAAALHEWVLQLEKQQVA